MKINYKTNPNTKEFWDGYYRARRVERKNIWLFEPVVNLLNEYPTNSQFLEVGCGMGRTMVEIRKRIKKPLRWSGIDISGEGISKAESKYHFATWHKSDVVELAITGQDFFFGNGCDFILCSETLEHLSKPVEVCKMLYKWLTPGGTLFITVPVEGSALDTGKKNLHHITFQKHDFLEIFKGLNVDEFNIDKHHRAIVVKKGK